MTQNDAARRCLLVAVFLLVAVAGAILGCRQIASPDLGWHLGYAEWIVDQQSLPETDPLIWTVSERDATNPQWLFQLAVRGVMKGTGT